MSWFTTVVIAIITAAIGCLLSGYVATLAIRWYNISSFEGLSGYYMLAFALLGLLVGLALGFVSSRVVASMTNPSFFKALGISVATMLALVGIVGGAARLQAHVSPTIDGETLMVIVEAKYPATQKESPATVPGISYLQLGSSIGRVQRKSRKGAFWKEDAKLVDGRWVVSGAVDLFTERGDRTLDIALNDSVSSGFVTRLPRRPGKEYFEWSEWYPRDGRTGPPKESGVIYRYRIQKSSVPIRTETFGGFEVSVIARGFQDEIPDGTTTFDPYAIFEIKYAGKLLRPGASPNLANKVTIGRVARLSAEKPALVVYVEPENESAYCMLLVDDNGALREQRISECYNSMHSADLTVDTTRVERLESVKQAKGRIDKNVYAHSKLLLFQNVVLNTQTLALYPFEIETASHFIMSVPPLGVAPDLQSYARYHRTPDDSGSVIVVVDFVHNKAYELPVDPMRMRAAELNDFTPGWLLHHFEWKKGPDGMDVLAQRAHFDPIPYHGDFQELKDGFVTYNITTGGFAVRQALVEYMKKEFQATLETGKEDEYEQIVKLEGTRVRIATTGGKSDYAFLQMANFEPASDVVNRIGKGFNAALATGRYDSLFAK